MMYVSESKVFGGVRLADMLGELAKLRSPTTPYKRAPEHAPPVTGDPSDKITMDALYSRYAAFIRPGDTVVLETGSSSIGFAPMMLADDVQGGQHKSCGGRLVGRREPPSV